MLVCFILNILICLVSNGELVCAMVITKKRFRNRPLRGHVATHYIYRLSGSLPQAIVGQLTQRLEADFDAVAIRFGPAHRRSVAEERAYQAAIDELRAAYEMRYDEALHRVKEGPHFLQSTAVKQQVINSWLKLEELGEVKVHAISVMSNHVHVILSHPDPKGSKPIHNFFERHKRFTATKINRLQNAKGRRVWATAVFDRDIRPGAYRRVLAYVLNNPVKAGLTDEPLNWVGNYVAPGLFD